MVNKIGNFREVQERELSTEQKLIMSERYPNCNEEFAFYVC